MPAPGVSTYSLVEGLAGLHAAFGALEAFAQSTVIKDSLRAGAEIVAEEARQLAPHKSGKLERAIRVRAGRSRRKDSVSVLAAVGKRWFGGDEFYGAFQEFGWLAGKRGETPANHAKRIARAMRQESRKARSRGKGYGLAKLGTATRERQERFFHQEANRRVAAMQAAGEGPTARKQIPGEHFMQHAFEDKKDAAMSAITAGMKRGIETETAKAAQLRGK